NRRCVNMAAPKLVQCFGAAMFTHRRFKCVSTSGIILVCICTGVVLTATTGARATNFPEVEPNDTKAQATPALGMAPGDTLTGTSTSNSGSGLDYFRVRTQAQPAGIYRYRLLLSSAITGQLASIRGLNQTGNSTAGGTI